MPTMSGAEIQVVGKSGQISLGRRYAGKTLRVVRQSDGSIVLSAVAVPKGQLWTIEEPDRSLIAQGLKWAAKTPARETEMEALLERRPKAARAQRRR